MEKRLIGRTEPRESLNGGVCWWEYELGIAEGEEAHELMRRYFGENWWLMGLAKNVHRYWVFKTRRDDPPGEDWRPWVWSGETLEEALKVIAFEPAYWAPDILPTIERIRARERRRTELELRIKELKKELAGLMCEAQDKYIADLKAHRLYSAAARGEDHPKIRELREKWRAWYHERKEQVVEELTRVEEELKALKAAA